MVKTQTGNGEQETQANQSKKKGEKHIKRKLSQSDEKRGRRVLKNKIKHIGWSGNFQQTIEGQREYENQEKSVIVSSYAVPYPFAVVIKVFHAVITDRTMWCSWRSVYVASCYFTN